MSGRCPHCGSTDVADRTDDKCECLECEFIWNPKRRLEMPQWMREISRGS